MVVLGALVKEECGHPDNPKARMGTVIKVTPLKLSNMGLQQAQKEIFDSKRRLADLGREYDPMSSLTIRPGNVFSVRWQDDPTKVTVHVAYDDCNGVAVINLGTNTVEVVK